MSLPVSHEYFLYIYLFIYSEQDSSFVTGLIVSQPSSIAEGGGYKPIIYGMLTKLPLSDTLPTTSIPPPRQTNMNFINQ